MHNYDTDEIAKFDTMAKDWWNLQGHAKMLHQINPFRLHFIQDHAVLKNHKVIDIGCGGGILTESLARLGAETTGIDLSPNLIKAATLHAQQQNLNIDYHYIAAEEMALQRPGQYDV